MSKIYQEKSLGILEKVYLSLKGRKDGKKKTFREKRGKYISSFIQNEMLEYHRFCMNEKQKLSEEFSIEIEKIKKLLDDLDIRDVDNVRLEEQIQGRKTQIQNSGSEPFELLDLEARLKQISITDNARWTAIRNVIRESIATLEALLHQYDDIVALKESHCRLRIARYFEAARKHYHSLPIDIPTIDDLCRALDIKESYNEERQLIEKFKTKIAYAI